MTDNGFYSFEIVVEGFQRLNQAFMEVGRSMARLARLFDVQRQRWLPIIGGEWPDKFTLLNRYLRTGVEPGYFTDERWEC